MRTPATLTLSVLAAAGWMTAPPAAAQSPAVPVSVPTPAEQAGYLSFTAPDEVGPYLGRLADETDALVVDSLSGPVPIPVAKIAPAADAPGPVVRVLVIGAQHGIERAGLEVGLRLARDLTVGRLARLRGALDVRVVPMANPWGVAHARRATEDGVDLDADHARLAAPETRALWEAAAAWRPDLVLDLHELGPSEYDVQIGVPTHPNAPAARRFARFYLLPYVANRLARENLRFHEYVTPWVDGRALERAATPAPDSLRDAEPPRAWFTPPPLDASSARNAFALAGAVTFFVAVPSSRDVIGLEERTEHLYEATTALLEAAAGQAGELRAATTAARELPKDSLALRARYEAAGGAVRMPWMFINDRGQREQGLLAPWRPEVRVESELPAPRGWWVAPAASELLAALRAHGFRLLAADSEDAAVASTATVLAYPGCDGAEPDERPELAPARRPDRAWWVPADQPGGRLLFTLVEPWSDAGWFAAGEEGEAEEAGEVESRENCGSGGMYPVYRAVR